MTYDDIINYDGFLYGALCEKNGKVYGVNDNGWEYVSGYNIELIMPDNGKEPAYLSKNQMRTLIAENKLLIMDLKYTVDYKLTKRDYFGNSCAKRLLNERDKRLKQLKEATKNGNDSILRDYVSFEPGNTYYTINVVGKIGEQSAVIAVITIFEASYYDRYFFKIDTAYKTSKTFVLEGITPWVSPILKFIRELFNNTEA